MSKRAVFVGGSIIAAVVLCAGLLTVRAQYLSNDMVRTVASAVHYPVLITFRPFSILTANDLNRDVESVRQFYEAQDFASVGMRVDFTTEEGKKRLQVREKELLNKHIEDVVVRHTVHANNKKITLSEVKERVERKMEEYGSKERVMEELERLYGWNLDDFEKQVVRSELYKERAYEIFQNRERRSLDEKARKKINEAKQAFDEGIAFSDVAQEYSEGSESRGSGEVGWVLLAQTEPALASAIQELVPGNSTEVIESTLGFHIVRLEETRKESDNTFYRISQIFVKKETFVDWIQESIQKVWVMPLVSAYQWNDETGFIEFSNAGMREFERNMVEVIHTSEEMKEVK